MEKRFKRLHNPAESETPRRGGETILPAFAEKNAAIEFFATTRRASIQSENGYQKNLLLGILALFFLLGIILGVLMSSRIGSESVTRLADMLSGKPLLSDTGKSRTLAILIAFAYPLLCFFLGLSLAGPFTIPLVFAFRAFVLTFAISSLVRVFGLTPGLMTAVALFALPLLFSLPCLFIVGIGGMGTSLSLLGQTLGRGSVGAGAGFMRRYFLRAAFCALLMTASITVELYLSPILLGWVFP